MTHKFSDKVLALLENCSPEDIQSLYAPISEETSTFSATIFFNEKETIQDSSGKNVTTEESQEAVLYGTIRRTCYLAYAKYQYRAWVELNGKRYPVDELSAEMNSGNGVFKKRGENTSELKKLDEVYEYGNACRPAHMIARARKGTASGTVEVRLR